MSQSPYQNPYQSSRIDPTHDEQPPRISPVAIVCGVIADFGSTFVMGIVLGIFVAIYIGAGGGDPDTIAEKMESMPVVIWGGFAIGCLASVLGGYVSALLGKVWPLKHAFLTGFGSLLLGFAMAGMFGMELTSAYSLLSFAIVVPMALLGGYIYILQRGPLPPDPRDVI